MKLLQESLFENLILEVTEHSRFETTQSSCKAVFIFTQVSSVPAFALSTACFHTCVRRALLVKMPMNFFLTISTKHTGDFVVANFNYIMLVWGRINHVKAKQKSVFGFVIIWVATLQNDCPVHF